jgi:hypothetical protein
MTTPFLNQIFYKCNKFDNIEAIQTLSSFMLTIENMNKIKEYSGTCVKPITQEINTTPVVEEAETVNKPIKKDSKNLKDSKNSTNSTNSDIFYPQNNNSLFWCAFIASYGFIEYEIIGKKYANREIEEKQKIIDFIKKTPQKLKLSNHKITNIMIQEILSDLMVNLKSSLLAFIGLTHYYNKHFYIVRGHTYLYFSSNVNETFEESPSSFFIIHYKNEKEYGIDMDTTLEKINNIQNNYVYIESIDKPLKGISAYKVNDLDDMCKKLLVDSNDNKWSYMKKPDLYKYIWEMCIWK